MIWLLDQRLLPFRQGCLEKENDSQLWMAPECRALLKAAHLAQSFPKKKRTECYKILSRMHIVAPKPTHSYGKQRSSFRRFARLKLGNVPLSGFD